MSIDPRRTSGSLRVTLGCLLIALLGALAPVGAQAQSVELRYQFVDGLDLLYEMVQTTSMALPGGMGGMDQTQTQMMRLEVVSVDAEGNARIRSTVESIVLEIQSPMGNQIYDSTDEDAGDPTFGPLAAMVGSPSEVVVGPDGRVVDASELSAWTEEMMAGMSPQERAQMEQAFSPEALENMVSQSFQLLPEGPIEPGATWESGFSLPIAFGTLSSEFLYTLEGVETRNGSSVALIGITGSMGGLEPDPDNPMAAMLEFGGGQISGTAEFDVDRGIFLSSTTRTTMEMGVMGETMNSTTEVVMRLVP